MFATHHCLPRAATHWRVPTQRAEPAECGPWRVPILNEELAPKAQAMLPADVQARIAEGYTQPRKLRRDTRLALGVIVTGSPARMKELEADDQLFAAWKAANYQFACREFGQENIVR